MFWKKKDKSESKDFVAPNFGPRESFRVRPSLDEPIYIKIDSKTGSVFNVSSGGMSFSELELTLHKTYTAIFNLPDEGLEIQTEILVLRIENENICYAQFIDMSEKDEDRIHAYVLQRQKENLKSGKPPSW